MDERQISPDHPLRKLFQELVRRRFNRDAQVDDLRIAEYVSGVLTDFVHTDHLYRVRNTRGERLEHVVEMLVESNPLLDAPSFEHERRVRKHIGDFILFYTGLFPEAVASLPRLRPLSPDTLIDYVQTGKESYGVVAAFNVFEYRDEAPLFRRLSDRFEQCVFGLNLVRRDLAELQGDLYRQLRTDIGLES